MIGKIVGNYKIVQALGEGGVGMVYKGVDTMLDREVAIKVLRPELASQTSVVERFRSEAVTLAKLSHPNIATLYSLFRDGQDLLMVLEFLKGETLDHTLYRRGKIAVEEAIPIFCQALEGINYAHRLGIVHRDIKPGNMMLTEEGIVKVLDFGIARLLGSARMTRVGNVIGTLEYMSPEQVRGHETDARSDVYGLGIMLYEMLTGRLPFESENDFALMKMQIENTPHPPRELNPDIPVEVEEAIMKSVAKDPNYRFQSAGEFLEHFVEIGFSVPNSTFYNRKTSRPSKPGINNGEVKTDATLQMPNVPLPIANVQNDATLQMQNAQTDATLPLANVQPPVTEILPPSQIPTAVKISQPEITNAPETTKPLAETRLAPKSNEIKGTRLAAPAANEMKATRLGAVQTNENLSPALPESTSFFAKLNWMHYTGAGVVGLFIFTLITTAAVLPFVWGSKENPVKADQPTNPPTTPAPTTQPVYNPSTNDGGTMPLAPSDSSSISNSNPIPIGTPAPTQAKPNPPQPAQKQPTERENAKTNSPPAKQQQPPKQTAPPAAKQPTPKPADSGGSKTKLKDILTDN
jgi:serine/threonine protein kinase